jgi:hypothetical protein
MPHTAPAVWLALKGPKGLQYRINRDHPLIAACRDSAGARPLNAILSIIERSVPIERIWLDVSETEAPVSPPMDADEIAQLGTQLLELGSVQTCFSSIFLAT